MAQVIHFDAERQPKGLEAELDAHIIRDPRLSSEGFLVQTVGAVKAGGAIVRFTTDQPPTSNDPTHGVVINGYGGSEAAYAAFRTEFALQGNTATTYRPPRTLGDQNPERMQSKAAWAVAKKVGMSSDSLEADLVTHSMGSWLGANIADHKPHGVRNLVVMGGAGLTGHHMPSLAPGAIQLGINIVRDVPRILSHGYSGADVVQSIRHILINPLRSLGEMVAVSGCDIRDTLPRLGEKGVRVIVVQFEADELFKTSKVVRYTEQAGLEIVVVPGLGHGAPITHPREVAEAVSGALKS